jgi:WD40 repeat protein
MNCQNVCVINSVSTEELKMSGCLGRLCLVKISVSLSEVAGRAGRPPQIVTGSYDKHVAVWHGDTGDMIARLAQHGDDIMCLGAYFGPEGQERIVSGSRDNSIKVDCDLMLSCRLAPLLDSLSQCTALKVWDVATSSELRTLRVEEGAADVPTLAVFRTIHDEIRVISGSDAGRVHVSEDYRPGPEGARCFTTCPIQRHGPMFAKAAPILHV